MRERGDEPEVSHTDKYTGISSTREATWHVSNTVGVYSPPTSLVSKTRKEGRKEKERRKSSRRSRAWRHRDAIVGLDERSLTNTRVAHEKNLSLRLQTREKANYNAQTFMVSMEALRVGRVGEDSVVSIKLAERLMFEFGGFGGFAAEEKEAEEEREGEERVLWGEFSSKEEERGPEKCFATALSFLPSLCPTDMATNPFVEEGAGVSMGKNLGEYEVGEGLGEGDVGLIEGGEDP